MGNRRIKLINEASDDKLSKVLSLIYQTKEKNKKISLEKTGEIYHQFADIERELGELRSKYGAVEKKEITTNDNDDIDSGVGVIRIKFDDDLKVTKTKSFKDGGIYRFKYKEIDDTEIHIKNKMLPENTYLIMKLPYPIKEGKSMDVSFKIFYEKHNDEKNLDNIPIKVVKLA